MFITIVNFIVYLFGPFGEWTLHKKGDCHLFSTPLEKGDSPLLVIES
jgi:hypothetical protein